ncbi:hypothetical protein [Microbacterium sp. AR7-10]|uniref:hypothetical protein n=1 Tax=Microbacterium sp. AR7-10 TaxID=1891970 RepID=UPI0008FCD304|nr:hypothetical protein [Microbacterium sp. AR7-10]OIU88629.1 hypothetical protein BFN01_04090 [Microbacterium sp. AR7-10]
MTITTTLTPRRPTTTWQVDDMLTVGNVRWVIRELTGERVRLEALNTPAGIWWDTTLSNLPDKEPS